MRFLHLKPKLRKVMFHAPKFGIFTTSPCYSSGLEHLAKETRHPVLKRMPGTSPSSGPPGGAVEVQLLLHLTPHGPDAPELSWESLGKQARGVGQGGARSSPIPQSTMARNTGTAQALIESRPHQETASLHQRAACPALPSVQFILGV